MSNPAVTVSLAPIDPSTQWSIPQDAFDSINAAITAAIQGSYKPYVTGSSTPAVGDQDKVWARQDAQGRPLGQFMFYNGSWRRMYSGLPNQLRMFTGDPAIYFDGTGLALTTLEWDGWAICNGQNGTQNLSNLFVVGGQMDNVGITGYSSGWQTNVTGTALKTGGANGYGLVNLNLPKMVVQITGYKYNGSLTASDVQPISTDNRSNVATTTTLATFGADPLGSPAIPQIPVPTVPPFYALAYCQFVGYA